MEELNVQRWDGTKKLKVLSFDDFEKHCGFDKKIGQYLLNYLRELQATTVIVENNYVDKDFLVDYAKFYARSFNAPDRFTQRVHFFCMEFDQSTFIKVLGNGELDTNFIERLSKSYLGFVVLKPIKNKDEKSFVGRTVLKTYPKKDGSEVRKFLTHQYKASLFGIPLKIESLPFQTQDQAVAVCATAALWVVLHPLSKLFQIPILSPAEITEKAVTFPGIDRNFPSSGLSICQMANFIKSIGLDAENINILPGYNKMLPDAVRAYINADIPLIACLKLRREDGREDYHAVVISGYRSDITGQINELYVHDDQIGPYSRVKSVDNSFLKWKNEWLKHGYNEVEVWKLIVPIYPKIRLTFNRVYKEYLRWQTDKKEKRCELLLMQINKYKGFLLKKRIKNKLNVLVKPLPRFIWVIRTLQDRDHPISDLVYDATDVFPRLIDHVEFC